MIAGRSADVCRSLQIEGIEVSGVAPFLEELEQAGNILLI
jgi:hypothetical protein